MATFQQQMDTAEETLQMMAETVGSLEQSIIEWENTLTAATNAGMMKELNREITEALSESKSAVKSCMKSIKESDGVEIYNMMKQLSELSNNTIKLPNGNLRNSRYERGKSELKGKIKRPAGGYGKFNDFNVQIQMLNDLHIVAESIEGYIRSVGEQYIRYHYTLQQDDFMVQFTKKLEQKCFEPRKKDFSNIITRIDETKKKILNIKLRIQLVIA